MTRRMLWLLLVGAVAAGGCAQQKESGPKVTGRILIDGKPVRPRSLSVFDVIFFSVEEEGADPTAFGRRSYAAEVKTDGTFSVNGAIGKGIPPGRYKVVITGNLLDEQNQPVTLYANEFTDRVSPLRIEITKSTRELKIDLAHKTVVDAS